MNSRGDGERCTNLRLGRVIRGYRGLTLLLVLVFVIAVYKIVVDTSTWRLSFKAIEQKERRGQDNTSFVATTDPVWILTLRIQKTGSSSLQHLIQEWLEEQNGGEWKCVPLKSCKTVHSSVWNRTWNDSPPCKCDLMDTIIRENQNNASACRAINGLHADFVDLTNWFQAGGTCRRTAANENAAAVPHVVFSMLRDPLDRVFSEYKFVRGRGPTNNLSAWDYGCDVVANVSDYLQNRDCHTGSWNRQTRMIAGHGSNRYWQDVYNNSPQQMLETAKENLRTNIHFGLVQHWKESARLFGHVLTTSRHVGSGSINNEIVGQTVLQTSKIQANKRNRRKPSFAIKKDTRDMAESVNRLDLELYTYATRLFWERYCTTFPDGNHPACKDTDKRQRL